MQQFKGELEIAHFKHTFEQSCSVITALTKDSGDTYGYIYLLSWEEKLKNEKTQQKAMVAECYEGNVLDFFFLSVAKEPGT